MPFCPNCSADLKSSPVFLCWNCEATFVAADGWKPTDAPVGTFRAFKRPAPAASEAAEAVTEPQKDISLLQKIVRGIVALPLLLAGLLLLYTSTSQLGSITGIPGALCVASAFGIFFSRSAGATAAWGILAGLLSLLIYGGLVVLAAAVASR